MSKLKVVQEWLEELDEEAVVFRDHDYDEAIVGLAELPDGYHVVYSRSRRLKCLMDEGMSYDEAEEWFSYNTERAIPYMKSHGNPPIILHDIEDRLGFDHG